MSVPRDRVVAPYGEWRSPIDVEHVAAAPGPLGWPSIVACETWWCASDPHTATVRLMRCRPGRTPCDVLGPDWSVRTGALGYGGRPYLAVAGPEQHLLVFVNQRDQRLYRAQVAAADTPTRPDPQPLTPPDPDGVTTCYADPVLAPGADEIWCVREVTVTMPGSGRRVSRQIVAVPLAGADDAAPIRVVAASHDFLSGVRVSPDGRRLAWIGWNHPLMPWDGSELMVADLAGGVASGPRRVLGGPQVSVPQVEWAGPSSLYAMADPDGWWNLHRIDLHGDGDRVRCVLPMPRDCAGPLWSVGPTWFAVTGVGVVLRHGVGRQRLALWDPASGALRDLAPAWTQFGSAIAGTGIGDGAQVDGDAAVVVVAAAEGRESTVLHVPLPRAVERPAAEPIACTIAPHEDLRPWNPVAERRIARGVDGRQVHYVYYPPTNPRFAGPPGAVPPLLVHAHGGPTSRADASPDLEFGLFCSRGFAVASVDYGGSTGYGRAYRDRLRGAWGIVDVEDCVAVAADLAARGLADPARTAIRGGSAGGWTTLACLAATDVFCAGAAYYPISDPLTWHGDATHDFESQYVHSLVGELPGAVERYLRVSPLANASSIRVPLVVLQGADDLICPPHQAQQIVDAVAARGLGHRYLLFPGEGHGFRKASSVAASLRAEAELYSAAMGIVVDLRGYEPGLRTG
ncbi:prolyl oligopeptidase family serine peptidase [Krasilnikovia sp. MM14-A1259]|uniref:prolyl oligopeptidase family serine peptidase n=1 Tax=Krasilnikovia sp. MM14-A1259 TaxID=3373539 RepID=UPI0038278C2A